jgi:hypothetical protein
VDDEYLPVADLLRERLPSSATLICYQDAGAIPYYTGLRTIDFGRLNDAFLARENPDLKARVDYFFSHHADAVIMTSESGQEYTYLDEALAIRADPRFEQYQLIRVFGNGAEFPYFQWVFLRKSSIG